MNFVLSGSWWLLSIILSISSAVVAGNYPANIINLDGTWKVATDPENIGKEQNWSHLYLSSVNGTTAKEYLSL